MRTGAKTVFCRDHVSCCVTLRLWPAADDSAILVTEPYTALYRELICVLQFVAAIIQCVELSLCTRYFGTAVDVPLYKEP